MNSPIPANAKPASAFDVVAQKLTHINVFSPTPTDSDVELFQRCGAVCMTTAGNIVVEIATKKLSRQAKTKAGTEALAFAKMADLCMARAAEVRP